MAITDPIEWRLLDTDFTTVLAILPSDGGNYSVELNEPAAGELKIPLESSAADLVTEGMFIECRYRGASRGGFLVDNINPVNANQLEGEGQWLSLSGRGALGLLDDAIIWNDNTGNTSREFTGTKAGILIDLIDEAKARGCFPNLTYDFTDTVDSESVSWTDNENLTLPVNMSLLDVLRQFADTGIDFDINLSGGNFVLSAYKNGKGDTLSTVYLRIGTNCEEVSEKNIGLKIKNVFQMKYRDGFALVTDPTSINTYRRREKGLSIEAAQTVASATTYGSAKLANEKDPQKAIDVRVFDDVKPYIFEDYDLGDYIILDRFGVEESRRVRGFRLSFDESGTAHVIVNLNSILMENEMRMGRDLNWLLNQWNTAKDAKKLEVSFWAAIGDPNITYAPNDLKIIGSNLYVTNGTNLLIYNIANGGWARIVAPVRLYRMTNVGTDLYITGTAGTLYKYSGGTFTLVGTVLNTSDPGGSFILSITAIGTKVYISGVFDEVNSVSTTGVAEYDTVGNTWADIGGGFFTAEEMTTDGSILYVGAAGQVKQWNGSWSNLGSAFGASLTAIAVYNDNLLAACADTGKIFEWDGSTWAVFGGGVNGWVNAIGVYLTDVYVGGAFTDVGSRIAKYSGGQWWILDGGVNATVTRLVLDATDLYVSGASITLAGDKVVQGIAAYFTNFNSLTNYLENTTGTFNLGEAIHNATAKSPMVAADEMPLWDSITEQLRKITWSNILLSIKTYADSLYVALTGNQTVAGIKTFSSFPVTPSSAPTTDYQVANKKYVDDNAGGGGTPGGSDGDVQYNASGAFGGDANFHYDAATNSLEIGGHVLDLTLLEGMINSITEGDSNGRMLFTFSDDITDGSFITFVRAKGTKASPTAVTDGTVIGYVRGRAWQQSGESFGNATDTQVEIQLVADGDWDVDDNPTRLEIYTTPAGSGTKALRMTIGSDGQITYHNYGDGTFEDTPAYFLGVDADGKVIEVDPADVADGWTAYSAVVPTRIASSLDGTFTVTIASPAVVTKNGHGLYLGQRLQLTTTGALPTGLATGTDYYVIYVDANTFRLATSLANAKAGTAINTSGTQSGTHSIVCNLDPAYRIQFAGVDLSSTLQESMPIKWTQNSIVRYGWICSAPTYSGGNTTFHVLTRCDSTSADYDVLDTGTYAISEFHYGLPKQPGTGFPALPEYWTMEMTDTGNQLASGATAGVDYNPAGLSLWVSIGTWKITGNHITWVEFTGTNLRFSVIGKVSDGISDIIGTYYFLATSTSLIANGGYDLSKHVRLTSPRTYHNLVQCGTSSPTALRVRGDISTTRINAVCAYL